MFSTMLLWNAGYDGTWIFFRSLSGDETRQQIDAGVPFITAG
jgi:hypothetical protein